MKGTTDHNYNSKVNTLVTGCNQGIIQWLPDKKTDKVTSQWQILAEPGYMCGPRLEVLDYRAEVGPAGAKIWRGWDILYYLAAAGSKWSVLLLWDKCRMKLHV